MLIGWIFFSLIFFFEDLEKFVKYLLLLVLIYVIVGFGSDVVE